MGIIEHEIFTVTDILYFRLETNKSNGRMWYICDPIQIDMDTGDIGFWYLLQYYSEKLWPVSLELNCSTVLVHIALSRTYRKAFIRLFKKLKHDSCCTTSVGHQSS